MSDPKADGLIIIVPTPKETFVFGVKYDATAEQAGEIVEAALSVRGTSLFSKGDTLCFTFVQQGGGPGHSPTS